MGLMSNSLFGTPKDHQAEKEDHKAVTIPEFDITQYAKKLGVAIGVIVTATATALKLFKVDQITPAIVVGALGVTAAALLGMSLVMAVDLVARAYLTGEGSASKGEGTDTGTNRKDAITPLPPGTLVWLKDDERPHPALAITSDGKTVGAYLVAVGSTIERGQGKEAQSAIDGAPKWEDVDRIEAVRPAKWP